MFLKNYFGWGRILNTDILNSNSGDRVRICFVCTHSLTLATLYKGLFPYLSSKNFDIDVIVGDREYTDFPEKDFGVIAPHIIPMRRLPSPVADLMGLARFTMFFASNRYDVIHISTPKASLLASIAARATGNGRVVFVYRRCVYELMQGLKRALYLNLDRLICALSKTVVPISRQLERFLVNEKVCAPEKVRLLGSGSSNGVDVERFSPTDANAQAGEKLRRELNIPDGAPVLLFLGRVCSEKGVDLLKPVFEQVLAKFPDVHLVVAGPDDQRDPISDEAMRCFTQHPSARRIGFVKDPEPYYAMASVFVFPSFFEGFGNVLLEAAGMERVSVAFDVPGVQEAVANGDSGVLVASRDVDGMANAVLQLLGDAESRRAMELRARERVVRLFSRRFVWKEIEALLREAIKR